MTDNEIVKRAMSILGKRTSPRKASTSRLNGMKGGRPKNQTVSTDNANSQQIVSDPENKVEEKG